MLAVLAAGGGTLQWLGPPPVNPKARAALTHQVPAAVVAALDPAPVIAVAGVPPVVAGRDTPGPVVDPDPALLEPLGEGSKENLPRIATDGRTPMQVYAAGFDHSSRRPRVALLLGGIGMNEAESDAAIRALPGAVSLAVSPYAAADGVKLTRLLATSRTAGHEYLLEIPLEPAGFPLNDPGPGALLTSAEANANLKNLYWAMSRTEGYVGAIGVIGTMRGERMAAISDQMDAMLSQLAERGLLYIDPLEEQSILPNAVRSRIPNARNWSSKVWGRHVTLVIDDPADEGSANRAMIDARLAALEPRARDTGSALGLVMRPTPVAVARILAWSNGLTDRGLALAPVSALAQPPVEAPVKLSERD
jgi:polysaccharide deacetylase 2 family uncharacterized protein YibQ